MKTIAFTGYRPNKLPFSETKNTNQYIIFRTKLAEIVDYFIRQNYTHFISGIASVFDTWAAEDVIAAKRTNPIVKLECAIPFPEQAEKWSFSDKARREEIITQSDIQTLICKQYSRECYFLRNQYMVKQADLIVCCYDGKSGGTAQTIRLAKQKGIKIIQIDPNTASVFYG